MLTIYPEIATTRNNINLKSSKDDLYPDALDTSLTELKKLLEKDLSEVSKINW